MLHQVRAVPVISGVGHGEADVVELGRPAEQEPIRLRQLEDAGDLIEEALGQRAAACPVRGVLPEPLAKARGADLADVLVVDPADQVMQDSLSQRAARGAHDVHREGVKDGPQHGDTPGDHLASIRTEPLEVERAGLASRLEEVLQAVEPPHG